MKEKIDKLLKLRNSTECSEIMRDAIYKKIAILKKGKVISK